MRKLSVLFTYLLLLTAITLSAPPHLQAAAWQQNHGVRGKITTIDGEPLKGVSVQVKGKTQGTITDTSGFFQLSNIARLDVLVISHTGFLSQEIRINGRTVINIELVPDAKDMEEVVVLGYGTVAKSDFTGSSSKVSMEGVEDNRFISPLEALQGRLAGVNITTNTGEPGSGITFNIRGVTSVAGNAQPLIVIDGQPIESSFGATQAGMNLDGNMVVPPVDPLAGINPADIQSVEILKDASSIAIYGSRGANGVVMITTKSGKKGRDRLNFSSRVDYNTVPKYLDVLNSREYMNFINEARASGGLAPRFDEQAIDSISAAINFDWQREILKNSFSHNQQLSLSGADERNKYYVTGNYTDQNSLILNAGFKRYGFRLNYERKVSGRLTFGLNTNMSLMDRQYGQQSNATAITNSNVVLGAMIYTPIQGAYDLENDIDDAFVNNPMIIATRVKDNTKIRTIITNATLTYDFNKYLKYTLRAGVNDIYSLRYVYHPVGTFLGNAAPNGIATRADNSNRNYLVDNLLNYNRVFAKKHRLNAVGGFSWQSWNTQATSVTNKDFPSDALEYYNFQSANAPGVMYTTFRSRALQSALARANYAYDSRYLLTLTSRADGSSRLAKEKKWGFFYSAGLGWNISNERFFSYNVNFINNLKLRASYGVSGMDNVAIGATQASYGINYVNIGGIITPSYVQSDFDNPNLGWESTSQLNAGIDVGMAKNRYQFSIDVYRKRTTGLLINLNLPPSSGYSNYYTNIGEVLNWGIDFEGTAKIINTKKLSFDAGVNFSVLRNKVVNMGSLDAVYGASYISGGGVLLNQPLHVAMPGYSIPVFWGYKTNGIYQNQNEIDTDPALLNDASRPTIKPGMIKYVDVTGDGQITDADKANIGSPFPDFTYGFNMNLSYKKFSVGMAFMGSYGNEMINLNSWILEANNNQGGFTTTRRSYEGAWRGEGTSNLYPAVSNPATRLQQRFPDWMVEDASFFRMQSLNLGYTFDLPKKLGAMSSLRAFLSGTNLFTLTRYSGYDPSINAFGSSVLNSGVDLGTLPQPRTYSLGLELKF